uniref:Guanylate cyclase n=1 Tax=Panagrolaimus sp. JU765 TaxID=591449 RepID=A0AC34RNB6_9BILA
MVEEYAENLAKEVGDRTNELIEEKKKSDFLLYRMLPKQVADNLKAGLAVEPENFESVTIFFSDVVQFTIGDGYLCVSGLPHRNENHVTEIADLSLSLLEAIKLLEIPHLPDTKINIRIGAHSGACTAGVVGLSMPRYCLFGDTVNIASRMESNGKAGCIQISAKTHELLENTGGFVTEPRGQILIKGKGIMETFWLLSRTPSHAPFLQAQISVDGSIDGHVDEVSDLQCLINETCDNF